MAGTGATTFARDMSSRSILAGAVESAKTAVEINRRNYVNLLERLHREIGNVISDPYRHGPSSYKLISDLLDWSVEQRDRLETSVDDVSDAEWERDHGGTL